MNRIVFTLILAILLKVSYAQEKPVIPACVIITGSYNLASINQYNIYVTSDANPGFCLGGLIRSEEDFYLLSGLQYVNTNPTMTNTVQGVTEKVNLQFLQIPLMAGFQILKSHDSKRTFRAQLGGSLSSIISLSDNELGLDIHDVNRFGFTFKGGIGADLYGFTVDIDQNFLLSQLTNLAGYSNRVKFMCWEFTVGYKINLTKGE